MLLRPNLDCEVTKALGFDGSGQVSWSKPYKERCAIIYLEDQDETTSVRTDSSASRASAREKRARARLLFPLTSVVEPGDKVKVHAVTLRVVGVFPRHNLQGRLDHYQVDCERWA